MFALIVVVSARTALEGAVGRQLAEVARNTAAEMADLLNRERRNVDARAHQDAMRGIRFGDADKRIAHRLMSIKQSNAGYLEQPGEGRAIPRWPSGTQPCRSGGAQSRISAAR